MESYSIYLLVTGLFHVIQCPQGSSMLLHMIEFPSFVRLNKILSYVYTNFRYLFICQWTFRLFPHLSYCKSCCNECRSVNFSLRSCFQLFWIYIQREDCWVIWEFYFHILRQFYTFLHNCCTILHSRVHKEYNFFASSPTLGTFLFFYFFFFFDRGYPNVFVNWYHVVVFFISTPLIIVMMRIFFICLPFVDVGEMFIPLPIF